MNHVVLVPDDWVLCVQPAGPSRDDLNKQLLQRLKEEADLGIEAMQSHTLFRLSGDPCSREN